MPVRSTRRLLLATRAVVPLLVLACASGPAPPRSVSVPGLNVADAALRQWRFLHTSVRDVEWMTCLYGRVEGTTVSVDRSELADIATAGHASVSGGCADAGGARLIGVAHSHPAHSDGRPSCFPSPTDAARLGKPWHIVVVVCDTPGDAVRIGYRIQGRHTVVRTMAVREAMPPLHLGDAVLPTDLRSGTRSGR